MKEARLLSQYLYCIDDNESRSKRNVKRYILWCYNHTLKLLLNVWYLYGRREESDLFGRWRLYESFWLASWTPIEIGPDWSCITGVLISFIVEDFFERIFWLTCFIFPLVVLINFDRLFLMRLLVIPDHVAKKFASMALMKMNKTRESTTL